MIIQSISQITSITRPSPLIVLEIIMDNFRYFLKKKWIIIDGFIVSSVLISTYIFIAAFLRWYYRVEVKMPKELLNINKGRYLIVANHKEAIDPYLILATLPISQYKTFLPIRFFVANIFLKYWWQRLLLMPFGAFRAYHTSEKLSGVKGALKLSDEGQSLFIFPEAKRVKSNSKVEIKVGVGYLAQRRDFTIIPVSISYSGKTNISWGKPFMIDHSMKLTDLNVLSNYIFSKVE